MLKKRLFVNGVLFLAVLSACGMTPIEQQEYFSPFAASVYHRIGYDLFKDITIDDPVSLEALVFLFAASDLNPNSGVIYSDVLRFASQFPNSRFVGPVRMSYDRYIDSDADLEIATSALRYLIEARQLREKRETLLRQLLETSMAKNSALTSEIATQLAILEVEKGDFRSALQHLTTAVDSDPYNELAFATMRRLAKRLDLNFPEFEQMRHLRRMLGINRLNIQAALDYASYAEKLQAYNLATGAYEYAAQVFEYRYPDSPLPAYIYLPIAINSLHTKRNYVKALEVMDRHAEKKDIILYGAAFLAAQKSGRAESIDEVRNAAEKLEADADAKDSTNPATAAGLAWYYSFCDINPDKALAWANRAYTGADDDSQVVSLLAYALAMNSQYETAAELIKEDYTESQISAIAQALVNLSKEEKTLAIDLLKKAVDMDPVTPAAIRARELLEQNKSEYIPTTGEDMIVQQLQQEFGDRIIPEFKTPEKLFTAKINLGGTEFYYGSEFDAQLVITNISQEPMVISDNGILQGLIRCEAFVGGDIEKQIPGLVSRQVRPSKIIKPQHYVTIPLNVMTGRLRDILESNPQADLKVELTVYIDPVQTEDGGLANSLPGFEPVTAEARRQPVALTNDFLMQRLDSLSKGTIGQKARVIDLFGGLLREQLSMKGKAKYRFIYVPRQLLKDSLLKGLREDDWTLRVYTMAELLNMPGGLDFDFTQAVSENISHEKWAVRLLAIYLLGKQETGDFKQVLDWVVKYDAKPLVRDMAFVLGGELPEEEQMDSDDIEESVLTE